MAYYLLTYHVVPDYVERRAEFREKHLGYATEAIQRGELLLGGAMADPVDRALLLFKGDSPLVAEQFARNDPYVLNGLVTSREVQEWKIVIGNDKFELT